MILERFAPVDEDHRNFLVKLCVRSAVFKNIDFPKFERLCGAHFSELRFDRIAQTAAGLGEEYDFDHRGLKRF